MHRGHRALCSFDTRVAHSLRKKRSYRLPQMSRQVIRWCHLLICIISHLHMMGDLHHWRRTKITAWTCLGPQVIFSHQFCLISQSVFFITEIKTIDNFTKELDTQNKNKQQLWILPWKYLTAQDTLKTAHQSVLSLGRARSRPCCSLRTWSGDVSISHHRVYEMCWCQRQHSSNNQKQALALSLVTFDKLDHQGGTGKSPDLTSKSPRWRHRSISQALVCAWASYSKQNSPPAAFCEASSHILKETASFVSSRIYICLCVSVVGVRMQSQPFLKLRNADADDGDPPSDLQAGQNHVPLQLPLL